MRNLLRGIVFGTVIGWVFANQQHRRERQAESDAFANDPEVLELRTAWRREAQIDRWLDGLEEID